MKKYLFIFAVLVSAFFTSCSSGSGSETKTITPTSTEFTSGDVAKYVEIVDQSSEFKIVTGGDSGYDYVLKVTLRMIKDGLKDVNAQEINLHGYLRINLVDENGTVICDDLNLSSEDWLKLKKLLTGKQGDTSEITFRTEGYFKKVSLDDFKNITNFSPSYSPDIKIGTSDTSNEVSSDSETLLESTEELSGDDELLAGSEDWDELLNSYEEYVDKYISYIKKAAKGDMSALSEYPALMDKATEFSEKMENAQSDMSASQWARYLKITNKMTKAAAEMQ